MRMQAETTKNCQIDEKVGTNNIDIQLDDIITFLTYNKDIYFKNQQKWEPDLTYKQKFDIALQIFKNNKLNFLTQFGKYLKCDQLNYFDQYTNNSEPDWEEIKVVLKELQESTSSNFINTRIKHRRYAAFEQMLADDSYFSEIEMMKRNPLLYEHLVGQYMSAEEKKARDKIRLDEQCTFVKVLMEGIERDEAELYKKMQEESEDGQIEEDEEGEMEEDEMEDLNLCTPAPSTSRWGEFEKDKIKCSFTKKPKQHVSITDQERKLLREEFVTTMYQSFLDGRDEDFDYDTVDTNTSYDCITEIDRDAEDKYFESEEADENMHNNGEVSSEDELDMYMNALNQHPAVCQLSKNLKKL